MNHDTRSHTQHYETSSKPTRASFGVTDKVEVLEFSECIWIQAVYAHAIEGRSYHVDSERMRG